MERLVSPPAFGIHVFSVVAAGEERQKKRKKKKRGKKGSRDRRVRTVVCGGCVMGRENARGWRTPAPAGVHPI